MLLRVFSLSDSESRKSGDFGKMLVKWLGRWWIARTNSAIEM